MVETSYIITFIGDDRPGLVEQLSSVIEKNNGSWHESRLSQLGGKFAGLILVSLPAASGAALESDLKALSATGLSVRVTATGTAQQRDGDRQLTLTVIGPDRLGIVREVAHALAQRMINVVDMESQVSTAAMSAEQIFTARIDARIPADSNLDELNDTLEDIANQMTLEIEIEPAD